MGNKGFTLIELLGVIVILTILSLITIPIIDRSLNQGKEGLSKTQERQIINGLKNYYAEHVSELNDINEKCMTVSDLQANGYLPASIKDPKTNDEIDKETKVCIKRNGKKLSYYVSSSSEEALGNE